MDDTVLLTIWCIHADYFHSSGHVSSLAVLLVTLRINIDTSVPQAPTSRCEIRSLVMVSYETKAELTKQALISNAINHLFRYCWHLGARVMKYVRVVSALVAVLHLIIATYTTDRSCTCVHAPNEFAAA